MRWMKLEPIIQSEVSQKEKHQYSILRHIYGIQKDGNNNPVYAEFYSLECNLQILRKLFLPCIQINSGLQQHHLKHIEVGRP